MGYSWFKLDNLRLKYSYQDITNSVQHMFKGSRTLKVVVERYGTIAILKVHDVCPVDETTSVRNRVLSVPMGYLPIINSMACEGITADQNNPALPGIRYFLNHDGTLYLSGSHNGYVPQQTHSFNVVYFCR